MTISYPSDADAGAGTDTPPVLVTAHQSLAIRMYPLTCIGGPTADDQAGAGPSAIAGADEDDSAPFLVYTRQIARAHPSPILLLAATSPAPAPSSSTLVRTAPRLFASGAADGSVKVWDAAGGFVTHALRGHGGPVSALAFHVGAGVGTSGLDAHGLGALKLVTGCVDTKVRVFDLLDPVHRGGAGSGTGAGGAGRAQYTLEGHVSAVRGVAVDEDGRWMVSGGRDRVVLVWDLRGGEDAAGADKKSKSKSVGKGAAPRVVQTILANETLESTGLLRRRRAEGDGGEGRLLAWTAGERGVVRLWDVLKAQEVGRCPAGGGEVEGEGEGDDEDDEDVGEDEREQRGVVDVL